MLKKLGLRGPDHGMLVRRPARLPKVDDYTKLAYNYIDMFGPVENQDATSECYCYSVCGMFEAYHKKRLASSLVVSKRAMASLTNARVDPGNTQDEGGYPSDVVTTLEGGYVLEADWPDDSSDDSVQMDPVPSNLLKTDFTAKDIVSVPTSLEGLVLAGHAHGPVAICVNWPMEWYQDNSLDSSGLLVELQAPSYSVGGHAIVLAAHLPEGVLFTDAPEVVCIRNSWGSAWPGTQGHGPEGYAWARASDLPKILIDGNCCMEVNSESNG